VCELTFLDQAVKLCIDIDIKGLKDEKIMRKPVLDAVEMVQSRAVQLGVVESSWEPEYVVAIGSRWTDELKRTNSDRK
jgi:hypothetical protein